MCNRTNYKSMKVCRLTSCQRVNKFLRQIIGETCKLIILWSWRLWNLLLKFLYASSSLFILQTIMDRLARLLNVLQNSKRHSESAPPDKFVIYIFFCFSNLLFIQVLKAWTLLEILLHLCLVHNQWRILLLAVTEGVKRQIYYLNNYSNYYIFNFKN